MYIIPFIPTSFLRDPDQAMLQYRISLQNFPLSFKRGTFPFESEEVNHVKADNNFRCNTHNILIYSIHNSTRDTINMWRHKTRAFPSDRKSCRPLWGTKRICCSIKILQKMDKTVNSWIKGMCRLGIITLNL